MYVHPDSLHRGVGVALYEALFAILRAQGYHTAVGGITLPNDPSVKLHERLGMTQVAQFPRIGWKFDQWHDVGYWAMHLRPQDELPTEIRPIAEVAAAVL